VPDNKKVIGIVFGEGGSPGNGRMKWSAPGSVSPAWFSLPFIACGAGLLYAAFLCMYSMSLHHWLLPGFGAMFFGFVGSVFAFTGAMAAYVQIKLPRTVPVEDLGQTLGLSTEDVRRHAEERGVTPPYSINGRDFYRPEDFEAVSLLRSVNSVACERQLLRASIDVSAQERSDELVRPSDSPAAATGAPPVTFVEADANEPGVVLQLIGYRG
jgi:hypothetical protein